MPIPARPSPPPDRGLHPTFLPLTAVHTSSPRGDIPRALATSNE